MNKIIFLLTSLLLLFGSGCERFSLPREAEEEDLNISYSFTCDMDREQTYVSAYVRYDVEGSNRVPLPRGSRITFNGDSLQADGVNLELSYPYPWTGGEFNWYWRDGTVKRQWATIDPISLKTFTDGDSLDRYFPIIITWEGKPVGPGEEVVARFLDWDDSPSSVRTDRLGDTTLVVSTEFLQNFSRDWVTINLFRERITELDPNILHPGRKSESYISPGIQVFMK